MTCSFTGHRNINPKDVYSIKNKIYLNVIYLIKNGVIYFGVGGARGFDTIAAEVILELRKIYPYIKLILVIPCLDQNKYWSKVDNEKYEKIKKQADKVKVLSYRYYKGCMQDRNRHLIDHSSYLICYKRKNTGGTAYTVNYAKTKNIKVIEI